MYNTIVNLQPASTTELTLQAGSVFSSFWPLIIVFIGAPLGFLLLEFLISLIPRYWDHNGSYAGRLSPASEQFMKGRRTKRRGERARRAYVAELEAESAELAEKERLGI